MPLASVGVLAKNKPKPIPGTRTSSADDAYATVECCDQGGNILQIPAFLLGWLMQSANEIPEIDLMLEIQSYMAKHLGSQGVPGPYAGMGAALTADVFSEALTHILAESNNERVKGVALLYLGLSQTFRLVLNQDSIKAVKKDQLRRLIQGKRSVYAFALQPIVNASSQKIQGLEVLARLTGSSAQSAPYIDLRMFALDDEKLYEDFKFAEVTYVKKAIEMYPCIENLDYISINCHNAFLTPEILTRLKELLGGHTKKLKLELLEETPYPPKRSPLHDEVAMQRIADLGDLLAHFHGGKLSADDLNWPELELMMKYVYLFDTIKLDIIVKHVFFYDKNPHSKGNYIQVLEGYYKVSQGGADENDHDVKAYRQHQKDVLEYTKLLEFSYTHGLGIVFEASIREDDRMEYAVANVKDCLVRNFPLLPPCLSNPFTHPLVSIQGAACMASAYQPDELNEAAKWS